MADFLTETRDSYDTIADTYTKLIGDHLASRAIDRAMLDAFAELVTGAVVDIGCGPGRVSAYLRDHGVDVSGIDLSPRMVEIARETYPDLRFEQGSMTKLDLAPASLGGIVAWYSIIHVPDALLPMVFRSFQRALVPGGYLLCAFQVGDERAHRDELGGHRVSVDFYRRDPDFVAELLAKVGLPVYTQTVRQPDGEKYWETTPQAYLLARRA